MESLISVIVPVYNISEFIPQCLKSLIAQTHQNLEIIVIDDGSTDNSGEVCDYIANNNTQKKIIVIHAKNRGVSAARNTGLLHAHGEYIGFVDGDDWVEPEMFKCLLENLQNNEADLSVCGVRYDYHENEIPIHRSSSIETYNQELLFQQMFFDKNFCGYTWNKLFVASKIKNIRFNEAIYMCENFDLMSRYAQLCNKCVYTKDQFYHYRQRLGSMTGDLKFSSRKLTMLTAYENILQIYDKYCPSLIYLLQRNYLKINLNIIGRMRISGYSDPNLTARLNKNINDIWYHVMHDKRNSLISRLNILLTRQFPSLMLRSKQFILMKRISSK